MKSLVLAAAALVWAAPALAQPAADAQAAPPAQGDDPAPMTLADGAGVVTAIDARAGTVTIHHAPIAKLNWPAMTMAFKATAPSVLQGVKVGQAVRFQLMRMGDAIQLTAIKPN